MGNNNQSGDATKNHPIVKSVYQGDLERTKKLLEKEKSLLHQRASVLKDDVVDDEKLVKHSRMERMNVLCMACYCGHLKLVQYLVEQGATLSDNYSWCALLSCVASPRSMGSRTAIVSYLLSKGASVDNTVNVSLRWLST